MTSESNDFSPEEINEITEEEEEEEINNEEEEATTEEKITSTEEEFSLEEHEEEKDNKKDFPMDVIKEIVKGIVESNKIPGLEPKMVEEFNTLLDEKKFLNEEVKCNDKKIIEVVKNMIRKTSIPGPGDELYNDLYKVLVKNLSKDLKESKTSELDAEVTARKLAAWVLTFDEELKFMEENDEEDEIEEPLPQNPFYYTPPTDGASHDRTSEGNVKLYNLSEQNSRPYWQAPGEVIELKDEEGSQIFVKGLEEGRSKKALVKKIKKTNKGKEVSSWVVEVADREQVKELEENIRLSTEVIEKPQNMKLRTPVTTDEWKTVAEIRGEEAKCWKNVLRRDNDKEKLSSSDRSKSKDRRQPDANIPIIVQQKTDDPRGTNTTTKKHLMDAADLKRSLKGFRKMNLNLSPEQESYLMNEMKKRTARAKV